MRRYPTLARSRKTMLEGIADGRVMAGECEAAGLAIHPEDGDVVAALVAAIEEAAGGVEAEAAGIVPRVHSSPTYVRSPSGPTAKIPMLSWSRLPA
jgi:hypothetical protein